MDINFTDLSEVPLPPKEVRIREFGVEPYPDGKRLRLTLELTPFLKPPSSEILITDLLGNQVASANIIETIDPKMQLTMHLRIPDPRGTFTARVLIFYTESLEDITEDDQIIAPPARQIVDEMETSFVIEE
ncbi:hypothetical protein ACFLXI_08705 [Chloroflexota bacterium]